MMTQHLLPDALVRAFGWTLAHSFWQAALLALALWFLLPRLRTAQARYRAAFSVLMLTFGVSVGTFFWLYEPENQAIAISFWKISEPFQSPMPGEVFAPGSPEQADFSLLAVGWLERHYNVIVSVWLLGFGFFLLRLAGGLHYVGQLRRREVRPAGADWQAIFSKIAEQAGLRRSVALLESGLVRSPMVIGYLKPVVLLPLALVNQLSPAEAEAVLAHELAHIVRRDWLLNLLQSFVEAAFYHHPAVWWMSGVIRAERENCCDDFAVSLSGDRLLFAKTLLRVQEFARADTAPAPALALALEGPRPALIRRRSLLLDRIKRILNQPQTKYPHMEKIAATGILLGIIALWSVQAQNGSNVLDNLKDIAATPVEWVAGIVEDDPENPELVAYQTVSDSLPDGKRRTQKITSDDGEQKVEMTLEDGDLKSLIIDGKEIPPADFEKYEDLTDEMLVEAMPPMEPMPPMPAHAPLAPFSWGGAPPHPAEAPGAPFPAVSGFVFTEPTRVRTDKDNDGNTIIKLERNGKPTEIVVKNGEVFVDGQKMENGQSLDLEGSDAAAPPAVIWNGNGDDGMFHAFPGGYAYSYGEGKSYSGEDAEEAERRAKEVEAEWKQRDRELKAEWKAREKEYKAQHKEWRKEHEEHLRELERQMNESRKDAEREMRNAQDELRRTQEEQRRAMQEERRARDEQHRSNEFNRAIKSQLRQDNLLPDPNNFSIELSQKELIVNGKRQPDDLHKKYLELYEAKTGNKIGKNSRMVMTESGD